MTFFFINHLFTWSFEFRNVLTETCVLFLAAFPWGGWALGVRQTSPQAPAVTTKRTVRSVAQYVSAVESSGTSPCLLPVALQPVHTSLKVPKKYKKRIVIWKKKSLSFVPWYLLPAVYKVAECIYPVILSVSCWSQRFRTSDVWLSNHLAPAVLFTSVLCRFHPWWWCGDFVSIRSSCGMTGS